MLRIEIQVKTFVKSWIGWIGNLLWAHIFQFTKVAILLDLIIHPKTPHFNYKTTNDRFNLKKNKISDYGDESLKEILLVKVFTSIKIFIQLKEYTKE